MSMSNLRTVESRLPPGFRFHPKDDELICDYLIKKFAAYSSSNYKAANDTFSSSLILIEVDLNKCEPWDIPEIACVGGKEWYFYSQRDRKYATGMRTNRATVSGYWKATGKDRAVVRRGHLVGMRKTLVFYRGRAPKGRKTNWVMHEFRLEGPYFAPPTIISSKEEDWVLCRVFHKSGNDHQLCSRSTSKANNNRAASSQGGSGETESSSTITLPPLSLMMDSSYINNINFGQTDPDHKTISTDQLEEEEEEEEDDDKDDTNLDHHDHIKDNSSNNIKDANANNYNVELQVPCFSIFSQNVNQNQNQSQSQSQSQNQNQNQNQTSMLTAAASNFPHIFSMENAGNNTTATTMISYNYNYNYNNNNNNNNAIAPPTMLTFQDGVVGGCTGSLLINPPSLSSSSTTVYNEADVEDNKQVVIRAMLSQLTKMEGTHNPYSNINYYYNMIPNPKQLVNGNGKGSSPVSYGDSAESYLSDVGVGLGLPAPTTVLWNNHHRH